MAIAVGARCEVPEDPCHDGQWIFTEEALARAREAGRSRAAQGLLTAQATQALPAALRRQKLGGCASGTPPRLPQLPRLGGCGYAAGSPPPAAGRQEVPRALGTEDCARIVLYYARLLPELSGLLELPAEVRWSAIVFYQRFYAVRSPTEFDPLVVMFACLLVSCKVEEFHEVTLGKLLEVAELGHDATLRAKVVGAEVPLLEAVAFSLFVEPKPDSTLLVLLEELRHRLPASHNLARWEVTLVAANAELLLLEWAVSTDAVLRWPHSLLFVAVLEEALGVHLSHAHSQAAFPGQEHQVVAAELSRLLATLPALRPPAPAGAEAAAATPTSPAPPGEEAAAEAAEEPRCDCVSRLVRQLQEEVRAMAGASPVAALRPGSAGERGACTADAATLEAAQQASHCHRAFDRMREEASTRDEAHRLERKRRWHEIRGIGLRQVPTPILHNLAGLRLYLQASEFNSTDDDDFVIHRVQDH